MVEGCGDKSEKEWGDRGFSSRESFTREDPEVNGMSDEAFTAPGTHGKHGER